MSTVANIYDNGPISPIAKIEENLSIYTATNWEHYKIVFIEGLPRSSTMLVEMVSLTGNLTIAANGALNKSLLNILRLADGELLHLRWEPLDDVEGVLWEQASTLRASFRGTTARVSRFTSLQDPWLATTTFWMLGKDRDINLEVRNPNPVALPMARFVFWGYRYILESLKTKPSVSTLLPAEGR